MRKVIALKDLDCANCAAKMEQNIKKIDGVENASVNFLLQKMTLDIADGCDEQAVIGKVKATVRKIEPDCKLKI